MDFSIVPVSKVFKTYQGQARIADLIKKSQVKRVQGQKDQVTISRAARQALWKSLLEDAPQVTVQESSAIETRKPAPNPTENFVPGI
jgi:hypothetical protein